MHDNYSALHARSVRELAKSRGVRGHQRFEGQHRARSFPGGGGSEMRILVHGLSGAKNGHLFCVAASNREVQRGLARKTRRAPAEEATIGAGRDEAPYYLGMAPDHREHQGAQPVFRSHIEGGAVR